MIFPQESKEVKKNIAEIDVENKATDNLSNQDINSPRVQSEDEDEDDDEEVNKKAELNNLPKKINGLNLNNIVTSKKNELYNCIPNDLLQKLDESSPVNSTRSLSENVSNGIERDHELLFEVNSNKFSSSKSNSVQKINRNNDLSGISFGNNPLPHQNFPFMAKFPHLNYYNSQNLSSGSSLASVNYLNSNSKNLSPTSLPTRSESAEVVSYQSLKFNSTVNKENDNNSQNQVNNSNSAKDTIKLGTESKTKTVLPFNNVFSGKKGWFCNACKNFNFESK